MSPRNHFSKYGGPYFVGSPHTMHTDKKDTSSDPRRFFGRVLEKIRLRRRKKNP